MTIIILSAMAGFAAGVITTLSWRKITAFAVAEKAALTTDAKAEAAKLAADLAKKV